MFVDNNYSITAYECKKKFKQLTLSHHQMNFLLKLESVARHDVKKLLHYTSLDKIIFYITNKYNEKQYKEILGYWKDYLEMCEKLEMVLWYPKILFPANLIEEHDRIMKLVKTRKIGVFKQKIKQRYPQLKKDYEYQDDNYMIVAPRNYSDIAREAKRWECLNSVRYDII